MREVSKVTMSMCPVCYSNIPAVVYINGESVYMDKTCPMHGTFSSMVERDARWYLRCQSMGHTNIYNGYFLDITSRCNLKCKYCYHPIDNKSTDRTVNSILTEAWENRKNVPFLITGGEPTLHKDIITLLEKVSNIGETHILTNGIRLLEDNKLFDSILKLGVRINLSLHHEVGDKNITLLSKIRDAYADVETCLIVIDNLAQIKDAISAYSLYKDIIPNIRIKAASNLWGERGAKNHIFVSDMLNYLCTLGKVDWVDNESNKVSYAPVVFNNDMNIKLVSWYNVENIDLWDIHCWPLYKAVDGSVNNIVTTAIINEGIRAKSGIRIRKGYACDVPFLAMMWSDLLKETNPDAKPNVKWWVESTYKLMRNPDYHLTVAEYNGELAGFMDGMFIPDPSIGEYVAQGRHMYVKPEYRDKNIAGLIHKRGIRDAQDRGVNIHRYSVRENEKHLWDSKNCHPTETTYEEDRRK